ncbi:MAG: PD-(D/E)XK nuclease-like domain-containing protein [Planctomycetia bacterium]
MKPLIVMPAADYHAEKDLPLSLSQSMAGTLVNKSASHAYLRHPKLGGAANAPTESMERGSVIHEMILGGGKVEGVSILDFDNFRTNDAKAARDEATAFGMIPMLRKEYDELWHATAMIRTNLAASGVTFGGQTEGVALWQERADDGTVVHCKARKDHVCGLQIDDVKTTANAHPDKCVRSIFEYGYDIQAAAYLSAADKLNPDDAGQHVFRFHFVELEAPYLHTTIEPDDSILDIGRSKWRRAINLWAQCIKTGKWPGYWEGVYSASAPRWQLNEELAVTADAASILRHLETEIRL